MPNRATPELPPERRQALEAELLLLQRLEDRAALDKYVYVSRAVEAGLSERAVAMLFQIGASTAHRWKVLGEEERERRRREDDEVA